MRRAAVQWVRNVPQRDGGRTTDSWMVGRRGGEELSGKKALSNGVQSDAIDAGAASGRAQARRSGMRRHHGVYVRPRRSERIGDENA